MGNDFLQSYEGQSTADLLALEGRYRIDSLILAFEQGIERKATPSQEERYVLAVEAIEREVNNGGYWQFFVNSSNQYASIAEEALRAIGCPKTADITGDALQVIAPSGDRKPETLAAAAERANDALTQQLQACDARYFANDESIADRLFAWIKVNQSRIHIGDA